MRWLIGGSTATHCIRSPGLSRRARRSPALRPAHRPAGRRRRAAAHRRRGRHPRSHAFRAG
ncbi:MAG TPA: hypothetical protein DGT21_06410 [Armatimonadetes bacterium]|nr:hypothetical protein [Armatimonadota bacterium]